MKINSISFDNIENWSNKTKKSVIFFINIICILILYFMHFNLKLEKLRFESNREKNLKQELIEKNDKIKAIPTYEIELKKTKEKFVSDAKQLFINNEINLILENIYKIASHTGLAIKYFKHNNDSKDNFFIENTIQISMVGYYSQITKFIYYVFSLGNLMEFNKLEIEPYNKVNTDDNNLLKINMIIKIYRIIFENSCINHAGKIQNFSFDKPNDNLLRNPFWWSIKAIKDFNSLEKFPVEELKVVGTIEKLHKKYALILAPDGHIYRVMSDSFFVQKIINRIY